MSLRGRIAAVAVAAVSLMVAPGAADAQSAVLKGERCATRLSVALLGKSPDAALFTSADPQSSVDAMLRSADFIERFSRFVNATFNEGAGELPEEDAAYFLTRYVLQNSKPWEDLFLGQYKVDKNAAGDAVEVTADPNGVGYFRSMPWLKRYAGNEPAGIKISTAYRMMNNTIGLELVAATNTEGLDISAEGRKSAGCRTCHYDGYYALDKTASVLSKKVTTGMNVTFEAYTGGPQQLLGGISIGNDKELLTALVKSSQFKFRTCRLAFQYLYGRAESTCEAPVFDACMDAFESTGTIQSALATVAKDAAFCQ